MNVICNRTLESLKVLLDLFLFIHLFLSLQKSAVILSTEVFHMVVLFPLWGI